VVGRGGCASEVEERDVAPGQRSDERCNGRLAGVEEARELVHVVWCVAGVGEELDAVSIEG